MDTTAGACAFVGAKAKDNGAIVQKLLDAGLIIIGKTNMTVSGRYCITEAQLLTTHAGTMRYENVGNARDVSRWGTDHISLCRRH